MKSYREILRQAGTARDVQDEIANGAGEDLTKAKQWLADFTKAGGRTIYASTRLTPKPRRASSAFPSRLAPIRRSSAG